MTPPTLQAQAFTFIPGVHLRATFHEGAPWFVAADVANALGYRDSFNLRRILDADEQGTQIVSTQRGPRKVYTINEAGVYTAVNRSTKPEAQAFRKWVTGTVLPSIRTRGAYVLGAERLPQGAQDTLYRAISAVLQATLRRYDHMTQHDHYGSRSRQQAGAEYAARVIAQETGLPLPVVQSLASSGIDGGMLALLGTYPSAPR